MLKIRGEVFFRNHVSTALNSDSLETVSISIIGVWCGDSHKLADMHLMELILHSPPFDGGGHNLWNVRLFSTVIWVIAQEDFIVLKIIFVYVNSWASTCPSYFHLVSRILSYEYIIPTVATTPYYNSPMCAQFQAARQHVTRWCPFGNCFHLLCGLLYQAVSARLAQQDVATQPQKSRGKKI
jgi:hypothetical protein